MTRMEMLKAYLSKIHKSLWTTEVAGWQRKLELLFFLFMTVMMFIACILAYLENQNNVKIWLPYAFAQLIIQLPVILYLYKAKVPKLIRISIYMCIIDVMMWISIFLFYRSVG